MFWYREKAIAIFKVKVMIEKIRWVKPVKTGVRHATFHSCPIYVNRTKVDPLTLRNTTEFYLTFKINMSKNFSMKYKISSIFFLLNGMLLSAALVSPASATTIVRPGETYHGEFLSSYDFGKAQRDANRACAAKHGAGWKGKVTSFEKGKKFSSMLDATFYNFTVSYYCFKN